MNHKNIAGRLGPYGNNVGQIQQEQQRANVAPNAQLSYVISESGSVIKGAPLYFAGGLGAALWGIDYHLTSMSNGISRIANTLRPIELHSFWMPDNSCPFTMRPVVQAAYSTAPFVADLIGSTTNTAASKIVEVPLTGISDGVDPDYFAAYVVYGAQSGRPVRVALINLRQWDEDFLLNPAMAPRGSVNVTVAGQGGILGGGGINSASVRRLHSNKGWSAGGYDLGGDDNNVTWAGEQWSSTLDNGNGHFRNGVLESETLPVDNTGSLVVNVPDTEAVIVDLGWGF